MKTPPWVSPFIGDDEKQPNRYLYGDKVLFGFPNRTYFELYTGTCSSDKIYSVQTKDFPKDIAAIVYYPEDNVNVDVKKLPITINRQYARLRDLQQPGIDIEKIRNVNLNITNIFCTKEEKQYIYN